MFLVHRAVEGKTSARTVISPAFSSCGSRLCASRRSQNDRAKQNLEQNRMVLSQRNNELHCRQPPYFHVPRRLDLTTQKHPDVKSMKRNPTRIWPHWVSIWQNERQAKPRGKERLCRRATTVTSSVKRQTNPKTSPVYHLHVSRRVVLRAVERLEAVVIVFYLRGILHPVHQRVPHVHEDVGGQLRHDRQRVRVAVRGVPPGPDTATTAIATDVHDHHQQQEQQQQQRQQQEEGI